MTNHFLTILSAKQKNNFLSFHSQLAKSKRVQDKLREEVNKHFDENGKISYDDLHEISYLEYVFYETLRLHSPAMVTSRRCEEDTELEFEGKRVAVKKGENLIIPISSLHLDENIYPQPNSFFPERFEDGGLKSYRDRCVLIPFGDGPR